MLGKVCQRFVRGARVTPSILVPMVRTSTIVRNLSSQPTPGLVWEEKLLNTNKKMQSGSTQELYDDWSQEYDASVTEWGYVAPSKCVELMKKYMAADHTKPDRFQVLDMGCGTGLVGDEFAKHSDYPVYLWGNDISEDSLEIIRQRKDNDIYVDLRQFDMNAESSYPYKDNMFDAIVCCGVLTYCTEKKLLFDEWTRIAKPGALIIVSHRSDFMENDLPLFKEYCEKNTWTQVEHTEKFPYLPGNKNYGDKVLVEIFVAKNSKN